MAYRPILNADTAQSWGDVKFGEPIYAEFGNDGSYYLRVKGVRVQLPDHLTDDLFDVQDNCLTEAGYKYVKFHRPDLVSE